MSRVKLVASVFNAIALLNKGLMIDMSKVICPTLQCGIERESTILYHDAHHLSADFTRMIANDLYKKLEPLLNTN